MCLPFGTKINRHHAFRMKIKRQGDISQSHCKSNQSIQKKRKQVFIKRRGCLQLEILVIFKAVIYALRTYAYQVLKMIQLHWYQCDMMQMTKPEKMNSLSVLLFQDLNSGVATHGEVGYNNHVYMLVNPHLYQVLYLLTITRMDKVFRFLPHHLTAPVGSRSKTLLVVQLSAGKHFSKRLCLYSLNGLSFCTSAG